MSQRSALRPLERRILDLADAGVDDIEIAWRFRRSPRFVRRVIELASVPRNAQLEPEPGPTPLRPIERRLLFWRSQGLEYEELAPRFRRKPEFLRQVEELARYKLDQGYTG